MRKLSELHLHLDGSLRPETVWKLAREKQIALPAETFEELQVKMKAPKDCTSLHEFLERFDLPLLVLQEEDALERTTFELVEDLAKEGISYAEIRFAPQLHTKKGLTQEQLANKVGISYSYMTQIEAPNVVKKMSLEVLFDIADTLKVDIKDLL